MEVVRLILPLVTVGSQIMQLLSAVRILNILKRNFVTEHFCHEKSQHIFSLHKSQLLYYTGIFMGVGGLHPFIIVNLISYFLDNFL